MCTAMIAARVLIVMVAMCVGSSFEADALKRQRRVVGGDTSCRKGEFPFHVSLWFMGKHKFTEKTPNLHHLCGGILVANQWVVTNAACFDENESKGLSNLKLWRAKLGVHAQSKAHKEAQSCRIVKVIMSPEYNLKQLYGDVAMVKLGCRARLSRTVATIEVNQDKACPMMRQKVTVIGWGQTQVATYGIGSDIPYKTVVKAVKDSFCRRRYSRPDIRKLAPNIRFGDATLCAGLRRGGRDACYGDGGSPLLAKCRGSSTTVAVGIVSYGVGGCAKRRTPVVYSRLSHFSAWIKNTIRSN